MMPQSPLRLPVYLALLASLLPTLLDAQEWTRFRGENGGGIGKISSLPGEFSQADYHWAVRLDGVGHSSPVLWGEKLFLTLVTEDNSERRLECYDSSSGSLLWKWTAPVDTHNLHQYNNFASSTPTVSGDAVYIAWASGKQAEVIALDHGGNLLWQRSWAGFSSDHGFGASPILCGGVLILHTDAVDLGRSTVMGLDPDSGETRWEVERVTGEEDGKHLTAYNTPVSLSVDGQEMIVVFQTNDGWRGIDPASGEVLWHYKGKYSQRSVASIAAGGNVVFTAVGSGGGGKHATALRVGRGEEPEMLYELGIADGLSYVPTPLYHENRLYLWGDGGVLTCRDAESGAEIYRERIGGNFFSSPIIADGKILCGSRDGELVVVALGEKFEILGRSRLPGGMNATPAVANNQLFLRTDTHLISIQGR